jgi:hypothetical protein
MLETLLTPLHYEYMLNAIFVSAVIGGVCAFLSCFITLKGWSLMGDALSHSVVPGVAVAYYAGWPFAAGAFVTGLLAALGMGFVKTKTRLREDAVIDRFWQHSRHLEPRHCAGAHYLGCHARRAGPEVARSPVVLFRSQSGAGSGAEYDGASLHVADPAVRNGSGGIANGGRVSRGGHAGNPGGDGVFVDRSFW